ncbi:MAG TPA: hypothetical protein ENK80_05675 [Rhodobacterales bacterium]|nr:hypothetical protein [Rhodobacterales bacterium]
MQIRTTLSTLWVFLFLNFIFCDVFSLMYPPTIQQLASGTAIGGIEMTQGLLVGFAVVMELGMVMVLAARFLPRRINRSANILVALLLIAVQVGSLFAGENTLHYWFFSAVEITALAAIGWIALRWTRAE